MSVPPIKGSWWVDHGKLLAGPVPLDPAQSSELTKLLDYGIKAFLDLREPTEGYNGELVAQYKDKLPAGVLYENFPILDGGAPETNHEVDSIVKTIQDWLDKGLMVYVHCHGGHGRTGMAVGCWLVSQGRSSKDALEEIFKLRQEAARFLAHIPAPQTAVQIETIHVYEKFLRREGRLNDS